MWLQRGEHAVQAVDDTVQGGIQGQPIEVSTAVCLLSTAVHGSPHPWARCACMALTPFHRRLEFAMRRRQNIERDRARAEAARAAAETLARSERQIAAERLGEHIAVYMQGVAGTSTPSLTFLKTWGM